MPTLRKTIVLLVSLLMVYTLSIGAYADTRMSSSFSLDFQESVYTPLVMKTNNSSYATIHIDDISGSNKIWITIYDSKHKPVSETITISKAPYVMYLTYYSYIVVGETYCLRLCS